MQRHEDLHVWQKSMGFVQEIYSTTDEFPKKEHYRLVDQLCRASISIPSNIAEGCARRSTKEFIRFSNMAYGSLMECETQLRIAYGLGYLDLNHLEKLLHASSEIARMLNALITSLKKRVALGLTEAGAKHQTLNTKHFEPA